MRKISANYIFPITSKPIKNGVIILDDNNTIIDIIDTKGELKETSNLEFYNGIIVPGFINTHCHLELSHLKNSISDKKGMPSFIEQVQGKREQNKIAVLHAIADADKEMQKNGIVAVADISNSDISLEIKKQSNIYYHTFAEVFGLDNDKANDIFSKAEKIIEKTNGSIVPHSPYSVSPKLFELIKQSTVEKSSIISIHNQESEGEDQLFKNKSGVLYEFFNKRGFITNEFKSTNKSSLQSIISNLPKQNTILVHNTYSQQDDIDLCKSYFVDNYWAFCPNSNLFIEDKLPNFNLFTNFKDNITIGTDSLASNTELSILSELKTISKNYNNFSLDDLLKFATINGAKALKINNKYGSLEIGKTPGLNLISSIDFSEMKLVEESKLKVLV